jgi:hypothetical protein
MGTDKHIPEVYLGDPGEQQRIKWIMKQKAHCFKHVGPHSSYGNNYQVVFVRDKGDFKGQYLVSEGRLPTWVNVDELDT